MTNGFNKGRSAFGQSMLPETILQEPFGELRDVFDEQRWEFSAV
jgi:hypothetical protein